MSKATLSRNGKLYATVVVKHRLDLDELTSAAALGWMPGDKPTAARIRAAVTARLMSHGDCPSMDFADMARDDEELEPRYYMLLPHVARTYGFPYEESK